MFARTTLLEIDTVRVSVDDALATFQDVVMPQLREQPGFLGVYALSTPEGRGMLISFWETAEQADAGVASGWYSDVLSEHVTMFRSPPGREHYQVRVAIPPPLPAEA
jgi:heme-degrading monooxygenase HmoA